MSWLTMDRRNTPIAFRALGMGLIARRILSQPSEGRVVAAFPSAFYLGTGTHLICVGTRSIEPGPIHVGTSAAADTDWRALGISSGERVLLSATAIRAGQATVIPMGSAALWSPAPPFGAIDAENARQGLAAFRAGVAGFSCGGISAHIDPRLRPGARDHVSLAAAAPITEARHWLDGMLNRVEYGPAGNLDWVDRLIGLGPGLTPSGDDFLGGMMIALHALDLGRLSDLLWASISATANGATNPISRALLGAAAEGMGIASIHSGIAALLANDQPAIRKSMVAIGRIGHSSGWDAMTGVVTVLDRWIEATSGRRTHATSDRLAITGRALV